jgi:hypothetical protein
MLRGRGALATRPKENSQKKGPEIGKKAGSKLGLELDRLCKPKVGQ